MSSLYIVPLILLASFVLMVILSMALQAMLKRWTKLGPFGAGSVGCLASVLFFTVYAGVRSGAVAIVVFPSLGIFAWFAVLILVTLQEKRANKKRARAN
ncbi:MAG: hypothetical protein AUK47_11800 [Deltaproteobacteria bacterium CG2_30_63_29]|nr:MAG: hypothetical protein AUK47_11800 [Deltaproteobacteria bacterium CG2_30_63_29]PIW01946.1 MAG: hypothetical protein COW42_03315 [Deltaproteobacteria bacterium CG17_big_fil_post_rev_8_21_14_2_50_63_7]PJB43428.1 MAG: hypothetical protein CO108_09985 [Deltaproteobacteria bacterium CG_4_9_14_3_um_filter_63_12]